MCLSFIYHSPSAYRPRVSFTSTATTHTYTFGLQENNLSASSIPEIEAYIISLALDVYFTCCHLAREMK
jgi:hypothetical protein